MKAIVVGAGRIGRGFITKMLIDNNVDVVFFEASDALYDQLRRNDSYMIHVLGHAELDTKVTGYKAYHIGDIEALAQELQDTDYLFTAVGGQHMESLGKTIGLALNQVDTEGMDALNIVTCENWIDPAIALKASIMEQLSREQEAALNGKLGVSESVVMTTGTGNPNPEKAVGELDTWIQNQLYLPIDKERIIGELPNWSEFEFVDAFGDLLKQKLYTNNTSVASIAFLGNLKGFTYVAESANDPEIEEILDEVYRELNYALIHGMGIDEQSQLAFSKRAKQKYQDFEIVDVLTRIARDPIRKLGPTDRLIGPARLALQAGIEPKAIGLAIAAALYYEDSNDERACELKMLRESKGIEYVISTICEVEKEEPLYELIKRSIESLKKRNLL